MADPTQIPIDEATHRAARTFVRVTVPLFALAVAATSGRIVVKVRSALPFRWDDWLIAVGCLLAVSDWGLLLSGIAGYMYESRAFITFSLLDRVIKIGIIGAILWASAVVFIKLSVAVSLRRLQQNRFWRTILDCIIGIIMANGITQVIVLLVQCRPLAAAWDTSIHGAKCIETHKLSMMMNAGNFINMSTDVLLSLYPLTFLYKLRRPILEKALIFALMAVGLTASAASIMKILYVIVWANDTNTFSVGFTISMWTCTEVWIGVTAACLPCLKSTMQRGLVWCGVKIRSRRTDEERSIYEPANSLGPRPSDETDYPIRLVKTLPRAVERSSTSVVPSASDARPGSSGHWSEGDARLIKDTEAHAA